MWNCYYSCYYILAAGWAACRSDEEAGEDGRKGQRGIACWDKKVRPYVAEIVLLALVEAFWTALATRRTRRVASALSSLPPIVVRYNITPI